MSKITWEESVLWLRSQPDQQELVRACYYDDPLLEAAKRFATSEEWQATLRLLPRKPGKALDLGAGRGISSYALARLGWQVDALEPNASPIVGRGAIQSLARESGLPIHALDGFAEALPCEDNSFDLVFGRQVMHHAHDLARMCAEIKRVLKLGGTLIATREHVINGQGDLPEFLSRHPLHHLYGGENAYQLQEYLDALMAAGLKITMILGQFDSPINYSPMTHAEWLDYIQLPASKWLGTRMTRRILDEALPWSGSINNFLSKLASSRYKVPGRLYSFVVLNS